MNPDDPDEDQLLEDDQFLLELMRMEEEYPAPNPRRERSEALDELLTKPQTRFHIPTVDSTWRNRLTLKIHKVVHVTTGAAKILVTLDNGKPAVPLSTFQEMYEKYAPSTKAGGGEPVEGEEWQSIHTSLKATILEIKQGRKHLEVRFAYNGQEKTTDMPSFMANWRRIKNVGKWHVGALKGLL